MEDVATLVKVTLSEIEKMLSTKAVVGDPVTVEGKTFVPLICVGFGFGAGGGAGKGGGEGSGTAMGKGEGEGGLSFTAGGGGVKPVAVIALDEKGIRVEPIRGALSSVLETFVEGIPVVIDKVAGRGKKEPKA